MSGRILTERLLATTSLAALILAAAGQQNAYATNPCVNDPGGNASNSGAISCVVIDDASTASLTNTATGVIGPPVVGTAISVTTTGTLTGGIVNAGRIVGTTNGVIGIGVAGVVQSGITNSGTISLNVTDAGSTAVAYGVNVGSLIVTQPTSFAGGISNGGTIAVTASGEGALAYGIVTNPIIFEGGVVNTGTIAVSATASVSGATALGASIGSVGSLSSLFNGGTIGAMASVTGGTGNAQATGYGSFIPTLTGGFANTGMISANATNAGTGLASAQGANLLNYTFAGGFSNAGSIIATATAGAGVATATGVDIAGTTVTMSGGILNSGTISGMATAQGQVHAYGMRALAQTFSGNLSNSGTIIATGSSTGLGSDVSASGLTISASTFTGAVVNGGTIASTASTSDACGRAFAYGLVVSATSLGVTTAGGGILNSGTISAQASANTGASSACGTACAKAVNIAGGTLNGGFTNAGGTITASATVFGGSAPFNAAVSHASVTGVFVGVTQVNGSIVNSGLITAAATNSGSGNQSCSSAASARAVGVNVSAGTISGVFTNSGTITASASETGSTFASAEAMGVFLNEAVNGGVANSGTIAASAQSTSNGTSSSHQSAARAFGISGALEGGLTNSGLITASATSSGSCGLAYGGGVVLGGTVITGVSNSGTITASAVASGASHAVAVVSAVRVRSNTISGSVVNTGQITATASRTGGSGAACAYALWVEPGATISGGITNSGSIVARASNPAGSATADGLFASFGGTIVNSGTIAGMISALSGAGIGILLNGGGGTIVNSGVVQGSTWGIDTHSETTRTIINQTGGLISGGNSTSGGAILLSAFADTVNISGGAINGNIAGGGAANIVNVAMGNGNTFAYANQITNIGTLNLSSGTLLLQNLSAPGVSTVNYNQSAGSTLALEVSPAATNNHASVVASGAVSLASGSVFQAYEGAFAWTPGTYTYAGVVTGAPITGSFTPTSNSPFFTATLSQSSTVDNLTITMLSPSQVPGLNSNQQSVASAIIGINGGNATLDQLFTLSNPGPALTQLSGAQFTQMNYLPLIEAWQTFTDSLTDRLSQGGGYGGAVSASYDSGHGLQFAQADIPQQVAQGSDGTPLRTAPMGQRWGVWARGYGLTSSAPSTATNAPYSESGSGVMIGADNQITDRIVAGVAVNIATDKATVTGGGFTQVNAYQGSAYGQYSVDPNWYVNGVAGFGWQNYSTARVVSFGTTMVNNGNFDGQSYRAYGETGYALHPAFMPQTRVTPYLGLGFLHTHTDSFTETGSATALNVQSMDPNSFTTSIGARVAATWQIGATVFRPELRAAWQHEFLDETATMRATFAVAPGGPAFTATGTSFGSDSFLGGAGITTTITASTQLFVDYDAKVTGGYTAQAVSGGLRVQF